MSDGQSNGQPGPVLILHAAQANGRPVGKSTAYQLAGEPDPVEVARKARALVLGGAWRTVPKTGSDGDKVDYLLRVHLPAALTVLPAAARHALTRRADEGRCAWDTARALAAEAGVPEPDRGKATLAFLGTPCAHCMAGWRQDTANAAAVLAQQKREQAITKACAGRPWLAAALAASGVPGQRPSALFTAMERDCGRMGAHRAALRWGVPAGWFTGDRKAIREVAESPVYGPALTVR